jgi:transposase-like protein
MTTPERVSDERLKELLRLAVAFNSGETITVSLVESRDLYKVLRELQRLRAILKRADFYLRTDVAKEGP